MQKTVSDWRANFALMGTRHDMKDGKGRLSVYTFSLCRNDEKVRTVSDGFCTTPNKVLEKEIDSPQHYSQFSDALLLKHHFTRITRFTFRFSEDSQTAISRNYSAPENNEGNVLAGLSEYMTLSDLFEMGARKVEFLDGGVFEISRVLNEMRGRVARTDFSSKSLPEGIRL